MESDVEKETQDEKMEKSDGCKDALKVRSKMKGNYFLTVPSTADRTYLTNGWQDFFYNSDPNNCLNPTQCVLKAEGCEELSVF